MTLIGTSGWQYRDWKGRFYPPRLPQRLWLEHYAETFPTVEVNNAFYRLLDRSVFAAWRDRTPDGFVMAVKVSRYLTHVKRLQDPAEPVKRFAERAEALGDRLGPSLLQLPPTLTANPEVLSRTLKEFPKGWRVAVEPRHRSWWCDEVRSVLEKHNAALCWADRRGRPVTPLWRTADFGYLRLHEGRAEPWPRYGRTSLSTWCRRLHETFGDDTSYVYFNNDQNGAAIKDAGAMTRLAK
jgi:uncharacterized protein YecE (DUF72 family)